MNKDNHVKFFYRKDFRLQQQGTTKCLKYRPQKQILARSECDKTDENQLFYLTRLPDKEDNPRKSHWRFMHVETGKYLTRTKNDDKLHVDLKEDKPKNKNQCWIGPGRFDFFVLE